MHIGAFSCVCMIEVVFVFHCDRGASAFVLGLGVGLLASFIPCGWFLRLLAAVAVILLALILMER